jgi:hypothetical protein
MPARRFQYLDVEDHNDACFIVKAANGLAAACHLPPLCLGNFGFILM